MSKGIYWMLGGKWCQLRVNKPLPIDKTYIFNIKIVKTMIRAIVIGVIDRSVNYDAA